MMQRVAVGKCGGVFALVHSHRCGCAGGVVSVLACRARVSSLQSAK